MYVKVEIPIPRQPFEVRVAFNQATQMHELVFWSSEAQLRLTGDEGEGAPQSALTGLEAVNLLARAKSLRRLVQAAEEIGPLFDRSVYEGAFEHSPVFVPTCGQYGPPPGPKAGLVPGWAPVEWGGRVPMSHYIHLTKPDPAARDLGGLRIEPYHRFSYNEGRDRRSIERALDYQAGDKDVACACFYRSEPICDWLAVRAVLCFVLRMAAALKWKRWRSSEFRWPEGRQLPGSSFFCPADKTDVPSGGPPSGTRLTLPFPAGGPALYPIFLAQRAEWWHAPAHAATAIRPFVTSERAVFERIGGKTDGVRDIVAGLTSLHAMGSDLFVDWGSPRGWSVASGSALSAMYRSLGEVLVHSPGRIGVCKWEKCGCAFVGERSTRVYCSSSCRVMKHRKGGCRVVRAPQWGVGRRFHQTSGTSLRVLKEVDRAR